MESEEDDDVSNEGLVGGDNTVNTAIVIPSGIAGEYKLYTSW